MVKPSGRANNEELKCGTGRNDMLNGFKCVCAVCTLLAIAGCGGPGPNGSGQAPTPSGCAALQKDLKVYQNKGVAGWAAAKSAGKKLSKSQEDGLRRYNELLNKYLGGKCHL